MEILEELTALLHRARSRAMSRDDLRTLPGLYRKAVAELAESRARGVPQEHLARLESLVLRSHALLYTPTPPRLGRALFDLMAGFPQCVRRSARTIAVATLLLVAGTVWGYLEVRRDPANAAILLPGGMQENAEHFRDDQPSGSGHPVYGVFYFTNNARVALTAYALGATFAVGTVLILLFNGVLLGATGAVVATTGSPRVFLSFILPHAGVELAAILFAAAAGLQMGGALIRPGWRKRRDAFLFAARESLPLALGATMLLIVAGVVEGWISPKPLPLALKAAIGGTLDVLLLVYLLLPNRQAGSAASANTQSDANESVIPQPQP